MYAGRMKRDKSKKTQALVLKEDQSAYDAGGPAGAMIRTQIYLTREEHSFLQCEVEKRGKPMASIIRGYIDEKMPEPELDWSKHPFLQPPADPDFHGPGDLSINHDHYAYGTPKRYVKRRGKWVLGPEFVDE
jgi:hypothetical protein